MELSKEVYMQIKPKGYIKPEIKNEKYYLEWSEPSFGIQPNEEVELGKFLDKAHDFIVDMLDHVEQLNGAARERTGKHRYDIEYNISPIFELKSGSKRGISYRLIMLWDAHLFLEREEDILVPSSDGKGFGHSQMSINWDLGELYAKALSERGD